MSAPRHRTSGFLSPSLSVSLLQKMRGAPQKMRLYNSSLCVPKDTELARSASLSHRSTPLLWQTGRLTSFIPVAPLCSSFFFQDNPHNNLGGECMTTQCSPLLSVDSVQRTGGYQRSNTPHSFKKRVEYTAESCHGITKGQSTDLITFHCECVQHWLTTNIPL